MRCYINNFSATLAEDLGENKNKAYLILEDQAMQLLTDALTISDGGFFIRLTLQNEDATVFELIDVYKGYRGDLFILGGGREGTQPAAWPAGTRVLCAATAGSFRDTAPTRTIERYPENSAIIIEIDYREGKSQQINLMHFSNKPKNYSVYFSNMQDGENMLLELPAGELPVFLNADVSGVQS